ncbi:MAG: ABC transporter ATP-binding protein, partial [Candidatus Margulisbacteria bacterium]|nr:ABC transporter ATP-binding protein [Candidatus Margulisiibacteriota bacterium]
LDVTIQAEILRLIKEIQQKYSLSVLYITHNFGIIKQICDRVIVMYKGRLVEEGLTQQILEFPKDAYTKRLIDCLKVLHS